MTAPSIERPTLPRRVHDPARERIGSPAPTPPPTHVAPPPALAPRPDPTPLAIEPVLTRLAAELPTLSSALVCSSDGRVLAAYGLTTDEATRLSVLTSSLHAMSTATTQAHHDRSVDHVTLASGSAHTVVLTVPSAAAGHPLVALTADDVSLGRMLLQARKTADGVRDALERYAGQLSG